MAHHERTMTGVGRAGGPSPAGGWPVWGRRIVSVLLLFHLASVVAGELAAAPSSPLEQGAAGLFAPYHQVTDQGYAHRYYAPEPGPTPIVTATIRYRDGRPEETVRLPDRATSPRLRYQRQLALANHLVGDFEAARAQAGDGSQSRWARSYARHLAGARPGCASITLRVQAHLIPDPDRIRQRLAGANAGPVDLDADEFYTTPERIGEFPCDAF